MKKIATVAIAFALVVIVLAIICKLRHAPIAGFSGKYFIVMADTAFLFAITLLLMEKK